MYYVWLQQGRHDIFVKLEQRRSPHQHRLPNRWQNQHNNSGLEWAVFEPRMGAAADQEWVFHPQEWRIRSEIFIIILLCTFLPPTDLNNGTLNSERGCICCVDYSTYAITPNFFTLYSYYNALCAAFADKLRVFQAQGMSLSRAIVIGFSMGSMIALKGCFDVGPNVCGSIHGKCIWCAACNLMEYAP